MPQSNKPFLQKLHRLSVADGQPSYAVGVTGRKLVEMVVHDVVPDAKKDHSLTARIGALHQLGVLPWITSHMHTLRTFGNEGVHEQPHGRRVPPHVAEDDVAIALFCAVRILAFWHELRQGAPFEVAARDSANVEQ